MILRRVIAHFRKQEWTAIALDFVIVVAGVFVGLQVDNWNQERIDFRREGFYLEALQDDFTTIIQELEHDIGVYETVANSMTMLIEQSRKSEPDLPLDELNKAAKLLIKMEGTPIASDTYANLTGSGDLAIIRSEALKNRMASFFGWLKVIELVANTHEMQLVDIFQPYVIENLDYTTMFRADRGLPFSASTQPDRILEVLHTAKLRNVAAVKWDTVTDIRILLINALEEARAVQSLLGEELD